MGSFFATILGIKWIPILLGVGGAAGIVYAANNFVELQKDNAVKEVQLENQLEKHQLELAKIKQERDTEIKRNELLEMAVKSFKLAELLAEDKEESRQYYIQQQLETNPEFKVIYRDKKCGGPAQLSW